MSETKEYLFIAGDSKIFITKDEDQNIISVTINGETFKKESDHACSSANKNALDYLPILGEGEAVLMGIDFPMPLVIKVKEPSVPPNSDPPRF